MKRTKNYLAIVMALAMLLSQAALAETPDLSEYLKGEGLTFGLIFTTLDNPVYVEAKDAMQKYCDERGIEMTFQTANDAASKVNAIESCVEAGCDIICYMSDARTEGADAVAAAKARGVTVGSWGSPVNGADRCFTNNQYSNGSRAGRMLGEWIIKTFGTEQEVQVGLLTYTPAEFILECDRGLREGLEAAAPNSVIVAEDNVYTPPTGMASTENFIQAFPDLKAILAFGDGCGLGAYQAFQANGLDDDQHAVFALGGTAEVLSAIAEGGSFRGSVSSGKNTGVYQGEKVISQLLMIHNGYIFEDDGCEYWPEIEVTIDNVNEQM